MKWEIRHRPWDDVTLAILLMIVGGGRVALAIATGETFDTQPTLALIAFVLGLLIFPWRKRTCST